ncbi:hypothetical protein BKP56_07100 [Marinilactibacillus sp. 15R]|uniref:hypothetical protein n=1 Tax=Marinilactibacillus sp. 15R TaxID=1911586 RepID=UPI000909781C|nr:hypothetical protein [Marinilactibacillus sp. 15R]API89035.1 hypothetical protein BKP56_07100 [Marinilactibacillus sp. 15R]
MNAQEAIDLMERELENYKAMYMKHKKEKTTLEQFYKNKVEALSIVLESAKVFHEAFENGNISSLSSGGNVLVIGATMDVDLTKAEAEKIGLEVEE